MSDKTFAIIKPDAVRRGLIGEVLSRFERKGFTVVAIKKHLITLEEAKELYAVHKEKPFYNDLCEFMTNGDSYPLLLEREFAIETGREVIELFRSEYASDIRSNCIHASDSVSAFAHEYQIFFKDE